MRPEAAAKTDCTQPFLVLIGPPPKQRYYDLRLVNPTSSTLTNVRTDTGGFFSDDEAGVINATGTEKDFGDIESGGSVTIEEPDDDELYEFVIRWSVAYGNPPAKLNFSLTKNRDGVRICPVPVLGGEGILIPLGR